MHDGEAAQHDVAEQVTPEMADRGHHPAHADRRADLFGLSGSSRSGPDHFLQRHDVGIDVAQDLDDAVRCGTAIHAAAAVNVVGRDSDVDGRRRRCDFVLGHCCRSRIQTNGPMIVTRLP